MSETRVEIDLNDVNADGLTTVLLSSVDGTLAEGATVTAFESEDGVIAPATVVSIDREFGVAYLRVVWTAMVKDLAAPVYKGLLAQFVPSAQPEAVGWPGVEIFGGVSQPSAA